MFARQFVRNFSTTVARRADYPGGIPGGNLPFSIHNRYKLTAYFMVYVATGIGIPYLIVRHQLLKK